jgi:uncharacterized membrane protein (DUF2068 family)
MATTSSEVEARKGHGSSTGILLIGSFKLLKGIMLVAAGIGALKLLHGNVADTVEHWIEVLRVDPENKYIHGLLGKVLSITPAQLKALSVGTFFYAALLLTEGIGLLMRKHWAEYFTVISTAALIPLEIYELAKHFTVAKVMVLLVNAVIVVYLIVRLRRSGTGPQQTNRYAVSHLPDSGAIRT